MSDNEIPDNVLEFPKEKKKVPKKNNVVELNVWTNIKLYLNKLIGERWLLAYKQEGGGVVIVNNPGISAEEAVFMCEVVKATVFSSQHYEEPNDPGGDDAS